MRRIALWSLIVLAGCVAAYFAGSYLARGQIASSTPSNSITQTRQSSILFITPSSLDIGEVWESTSHEVRLEVKNTGTKQVTIQRFVSGCNCTNITPETVTLEPQASQPVLVTINTTHRLPHSRGVSKWPLAITIRALTDRPEGGEDSWQIAGVVKAWASTETPWLDFDDRCQHTGPPSTRTIRMKRHAPLNRLVATVDPARASAVVKAVAGMDDEYDVSVTPNPDLAVGEFRFDVQLEAVDSSGGRHPVCPLPIRGEMQPPVRVVPRMVLLGEHAVGARPEGEVELHLPKGNGWTVKQIDSASPDVTVTLLTPARPGVLRYKVAHRVVAGDQRTPIEFVMTGPDGKTVRTKTEVQAFGLPVAK